MKFLSYARILSLVTLVGTLSFMSGCSASMNLPDTQGTADLGTVRGGSFGGQQPITGAHIFLFETPSSAGYGDTLPVSLLGNAGSTSLSCAPGVALPLVYVAANSTTGTPAECYYQTTGYNGSNAQNNTLGAGSAGEFNLTGLYSCDVGQNVWIYSISGYPDTASPSDLNPYASEMADLGPCTSGNFSSDSYIFVNELSTVAMVYSVAGFTADALTNTTTGAATKISAPSTNSTGINNAFLTSQQLYNIFGLTDQGDLSAPHTTTTGTRNGLPPYQLINTLGDVMAACINSTGNASTISTNCSNLFTDVYGNGTTITDTTSAMIHIAKHPNTANPSALFVLLASNPVWNPYYTVSTAPVDLSVAILYNNGANFTPKGVAMDPLGNAFVNYYASSGYTAKISPLGAITTTANITPAVNDGVNIAVDNQGYIWTPSYATGDVFQTTNTTTFTAVTDTPSGLSTGIADGIAVGSSGNTYIADPNYTSPTNTGGSKGELYEITNYGAGAPTPLLSTGNGGVTKAAKGGCLNKVNGVAIDGSALWIVNNGVNDQVCRISPDGTTLYNGLPQSTSSNGNPITEADLVAVGKGDTAWVIDTKHNSLYNVPPTGSAVLGPFNGGGMTTPVGLITDGLGYVWTVNTAGTSGSISEFDTAGNPVSGSQANSNTTPKTPAGLGFQYGAFGTPSGIAVDISGDLWIANFGKANVVEVIGIAAPTAPLGATTPGKAIPFEP